MGRTGVVIVSRCAWTLHNFRRNLILAAAARETPVIAAGASFDDFGERLRAEGIDFRPAPVPLKGVSPLGDMKLLLRFYRMFREARPRVVHCFTIKPVIYGTLAAALAGAPNRICTVTGLGHAFTDGGPLVRFAAETLYRLALAFATTVFFQNAEDLDLFVRRGIVRRSKARLVAGSGVDLNHFQPPPPGKAGPLRFLMVARLLREKGVIELIDAAERLAAAGVDVDVALVGAEDSRNPTALSADEMRRLQDSPVRWLGAVKDVRPVIADADVVVLPSYREGTPRGLLEAMAMGRPILTTNAPGCRDMVDGGRTGLLVEPRDGVALADAMAAMAATPRTRLTEMGADARRFVEQNYDEKRVISDILDIYEARR